MCIRNSVLLLSLIASASAFAAPTHLLARDAKVKSVRCFITPGEDQAGDPGIALEHLEARYHISARVRGEFWEENQQGDPDGAIEPLFLKGERVLTKDVNWESASATERAKLQELCGDLNHARKSGEKVRIYAESASDEISSIR